MSVLSPDYFIHIANLLMLVAYSVRDILWLRLFAVGASLASMPFFFLQQKILWAPLAWSLLFTVINLLQSWRLLLERRPVQLTPEEETVKRLVFPNIHPRKVLQLLAIGKWSSIPAGQRLISSGIVPDTLSLIVRGKVRVSRQGQDVGELAAGEIVGSALILNGVPADVTAESIEPVRALTWDIAILKRYLDAQAEMRAALQQHLVRDLGAKLDRVTRGTSSA